MLVYFSSGKFISFEFTLRQKAWFQFMFTNMNSVPIENSGNENAKNNSHVIVKIGKKDRTLYI